MKYFLLGCVIIANLLATGCATMDADYEEPKVDVVGISKSEDAAAGLQFTLQLRIVNPNATDLELKGLYYEISLDGIDLVSGTANNLPTIEAFSEETVSVNAAPSLVNSVRLASRLMDFTGSEIPYELKAKLGTTSKWMPSRTIRESGTIPLR